MTIETTMPPLVIHTDGACLGNPGPGGYAAVWEADDGPRELSGGRKLTTNNRMELLAVITALNTLTRPCEIILHTDSQYVKNGITSWIHGWKKNGWKTADRKPVKNADLWMALDEAQKRHRIDWRWVKAHKGHEFNERADELANRGVEMVQRTN